MVAIRGEQQIDMIFPELESAIDIFETVRDSLEDNLDVLLDVGAFQPDELDVGGLADVAPRLRAAVHASAAVEMSAVREEELAVLRRRLGLEEQAPVAMHPKFLVCCQHPFALEGSHSQFLTIFIFQVKLQIQNSLSVLSKNTKQNKSEPRFVMRHKSFVDFFSEKEQQIHSLMCNSSPLQNDAKINLITED